MHSHDHHHHPAPPDFGNAFIIGIGLNVGFVIIEAVCGFLFGSVSLLADAGHNLSDVFGLLMAFVAFRLEKIAPSKHFTYGLGSSTIMASAINGALLLMAVGAIAWEAVGRLFDPQLTQGMGMVWVAAVGVVINTATAMLFYSGRRNDINIKGAYLHMLADSLVSVGVVVAGVIILTTQWTWVDPLVSLIISAVILLSSWGLFRDALGLLAHGVPDKIKIDEVRGMLLTLPDVRALHDLHVWAISSSTTALTVHLVVDRPEASVKLLELATEKLAHDFEINHCTLQIESPEIAAKCHLLPDSIP